MAHAHDTETREQHRHDHCQNDYNAIASPTLYRRKTLITYGKKDRKLLSLSATQFRLSNEEPSNSKAVAERSQEDSVGSSSGSPNKRKTSSRPQEKAVKHRKAGKRKLHRAQTAGSGHLSRVDALGTPFEGERAYRPSSELSSAKACRRLPVNELILVSDAADSEHDIEPLTSPAAEHVRDPIQNVSSSPKHRRWSTSIIPEQKPVLTPLSILRTRLKPPRSSMKRLRPVNCTRLGEPEQMGRDGFDNVEMRRKLPTRRSKTLRSARSPLIVGSDALRLCYGPLPDVEFFSPTSELQVGIHEPSQTQLEYQSPAAAALSYPPPPTPALAVRDEATESSINAQLKSISAPKWVASDSEESDEEERAEECAEQDHIRQQEGEVNLRSIHNAINPQEGAALEEERTRSNGLQPQGGTRSKSGIMLDFRQPLIPGQLPTQPLGKRDLVEVSEPIFEVPQSGPPLAGLSKISIFTMPQNTRRWEQAPKSTRQRSIADACGSRYFTRAISLLDEPQMCSGSIVSRRPSGYFAIADVQMPGSDRVVPQTSSGLPAAVAAAADW